MRSFHNAGRSPVIARHAMAATSHPLATLAAVECLKSGGNAVDAAITATALLCVIEPAMTGIGGDCFALIHKPGQGLIALNGSGRAPRAATADWYAGKGIKAIEVTSPHAVTIPGAIDAWDRLLRDHGSISLANALAPAIDAAEHGFAVAPRVAHDWRSLEAKIRMNEGARRHLLINDQVPRVGQVMRMPALAATLKTIAREGREVFYSGQIASDMAAELAALGGLHTLSDFASHVSDYVTPITVDYRGVELVELPPNTQGIVALIILKMLDKIGSRGGDPMSAERWHVMLEAARLAYAARDRFVADPASAEVPATFLLSDSFAANLVDRIDRKRRREDLGPIPQPSGSDTTYLTVVDRSGMAVSFINSLFAGFGSGIVTRRTGVVLQNRGSGFNLAHGHPNCVAPAKRPLHTLVPAMAMRAGKPWLSFGVMGGMLQPAGHAFVLTNRLDFGMDAQEAVDAPRIFYEGGEVLAESSVPVSTREGLAALGHRVGLRTDPWGGSQLIEFDHAQGVLIGASDPRKDGAALGY
jgi:gamma-glutamyltranspeptidase/glutathione hydrolase